MAHVEDRWKRDGRSAGRRWRVRYAGPDGRERNRSFDRKIDADRFKVAVEADVQRGTYTDPAAGKITLRRYAATWQAGYSPDTSRGEHIATHLALHIFPVLGDVTLGQLADRPSMIRQWLTGLPLAASSARQVFITLSAILGAAVDDGLISRNPCRAASVRLRTAPQRKIVPWTAVQVAAIRAGMPDRFRAVVDCGAGLGLRQGEVFGLCPDAVDFLHRNRTVHVNRQVLRVNGRLWLAAPKEGKDRRVPLPGPVSLALAAHMAAFPPATVTLPWNEPGSRRHGDPVTIPLLFSTPAGGALNSSTFGKAWRRARGSAGISDGGMHMLRHYYASVLLAGGVDIRALSEYLGHRDPAFTLRIYSHLMPSAEGRALRAIEAAFAEDHGPGTAQEAESP
ncbi:MAG: tyrosine-type recombinase/integrase [Streptosporangiaceae bacterium]